MILHYKISSDCVQIEHGIPYKMKSDRVQIESTNPSLMSQTGIKGKIVMSGKLLKIDSLLKTHQLDHHAY